jgi:hypothetical protein
MLLAQKIIIAADQLKNGVLINGVTLASSSMDVEMENYLQIDCG